MIILSKTMPEGNTNFILRENTAFASSAALWTETGEPRTLNAHWYDL